ncbi:hypothetical protein WOA01_10645 [Methylocystis sp. IM2]|uniref:hypothetical protein n=1 Tax=Methylocystis sp. IM2 TaxID=3136563 RepID=UPI0030F6FA72
MEGPEVMDRLKSLLGRMFWLTLAIVFLIEAWIWDHVRDWLRQLERALGLERIEPWLSDLVDRLSPPMTLALFAVPMVGVLPIKVAALALLASGHVFLGVLFIFFSKSLTLGVEAFLFDICRDKLLQMAWFARLYSIVIEIRDWSLALVRPLKLRAMASFARTRQGRRHHGKERRGFPAPRRSVAERFAPEAPRLNSYSQTA